MLRNFSRLLAMAGTTARRAIADRVRDRVIAGRCLHEGCECEVHSRGVCARHYSAFQREMQARGGKKEQAEFEAAAIEGGLILAVNEVRAIRRPNPFAKVG